MGISDNKRDERWSWPRPPCEGEESAREPSCKAGSRLSDAGARLRERPVYVGVGRDRAAAALPAPPIPLLDNVDALHLDLQLDLRGWVSRTRRLLAQCGRDRVLRWRAAHPLKHPPLRERDHDARPPILSAAPRSPAAVLCLPEWRSDIGLASAPQYVADS
jgi:hypothetical protein